jgi:hypothetical protein
MNVAVDTDRNVESAPMVDSSPSISSPPTTACAHAQGVLRMSNLRWESGESPAIN